jgi:hypothetical protein
MSGTLADVRLIRILEALKVKTRQGELDWTPVASGYMYSGSAYSATIAGRSLE